MKTVELQQLDVHANLTVRIGPVITVEIAGVQLELEPMIFTELVSKLAVNNSDEDSVGVDAELLTELGLELEADVHFPCISPACLAGGACDTALNLAKGVLESDAVSCGIEVRSLELLP